MSYPQQPSGWTDPSWPADPPVAQPYEQSYEQPYSGTPASPAGYAGYGVPASPPGYPPGYQYGYGGPVVAAGPGTNGLSIAAMVISIVGAVGLICYGVGGFIGIVGAIMGHVAKRQIAERGEGGRGMALAGIIVGWISTVLAVIVLGAIIALFVWAAKQAPSQQPYPYPTS